MKRFQSRIESLRRLRQQAEKFARLSAAVRQAEKREADQMVEQVTEHIVSLQQMGMRELTNGNTNLLQAVISAAAKAGADLSAAKQQQGTANLLLQHAVREVAAAKSQLQIVEKHREKEFAEYRRKVLIAEENSRMENNGRRFAAAKGNWAAGCSTAEPADRDAAVAQRPVGETLIADIEAAQKMPSTAEVVR